MTKLKRILLVEDSINDAELTLSALESINLANKVDTVADGALALDYIYCRGSFADRPRLNPAIILLDLKLPKVSGLEVLKELKGDPLLKRIPVVILTSSKEEKDIIMGYDLGVNAYVVKPVEYSEFIIAIKQLGLFWAIINEAPRD
jgi:DNA-binding response OmpR family regulator